MLAVFAEFEREILRERVKAGIAQARARGRPHGRPPTVKARSAEIKRLFARGLSKREIAKRLKVGRTSVRRVLARSCTLSKRATIFLATRPDNGRKLVYCLPFPLRTGLTDLELSDQRPRQ